MAAAILLAACQKENTSPKTPGSVKGSTGTAGTSLSSSETPTPLDGTYTGNFSLSNTAPATNLPVQLILAGNQFNSGDLNNSYSVGGGTVAITDSVLNFTDIEAFPDNIRGSMIPSSLIGLSGNYDYKIKGDSLLLSKTEKGYTFTYKLKKQ